MLTVTIVGPAGPAVPVRVWPSGDKVQTMATPPEVRAVTGAPIVTFRVSPGSGSLTGIVPVATATSVASGGESALPVGRASSDTRAVAGPATGGELVPLIVMVRVAVDAAPSASVTVEVNVSSIWSPWPSACTAGSLLFS